MKSKISGSPALNLVVVAVLGILNAPFSNLWAQGVIALDTSSGGGLVSFSDANDSDPYLTPIPGLNGETDTFYDLNVELLYGTTPNNVNTPVATLLRSSNNTGDGGTELGQVLTAAGDITTYANGSIVDNSGEEFSIPNVPPGGTAYFQILAWTGSVDSYQAALSWYYSDPQLGGRFFVLYSGETGVFSEQLGSPTSPIQENLNNMPHLVLSPGSGELDVYGTLDIIPEPSPFEMACISSFSLLVLGCANLFFKKMVSVR